MSMMTIRFPLEITGRRELAVTASASERVATELYAFLSVGKGQNPFLERDGMVMDTPVYSPQNESAWSRIKGDIRRFFDALTQQRTARLVRIETLHKDGETALNVEFLSLEDNAIESMRWAP